MIKIIRSAERHHGDFGWLQTHWHFSFGDYHDRNNMHWGALRVFNDDVIRGGGGFDMHPHQDMEIVTYVLSGALEHQDSLGNRGVIRPGEVQVMSAGSGITHAEYNHSETESVHLIQLWIFPRTRGREARWEQKQFSAQERAGKLLPVVSSGEKPGTLAIDQDAAIYVSSLAAGQRLTHATDPARKLYLFVIEGRLRVNGTDLAAGDQARMDELKEVEIVADEAGELMLLDLPDV